MIKQLLNSGVAKYGDLFAAKKSQYFAQPRPIIGKYLCVQRGNLETKRCWLSVKEWTRRQLAVLLIIVLLNIPLCL